MTKIYFITNRKPIPEKDEWDWGNYLNCDLRFGEVDVTDDSELLDSRLYDDNPEKGSNHLFCELQSSMKDQKKDTIIYIHGFSTSHKEALERTAWINSEYQDLNDGVGANLVCFSWPSNDELSDYRLDRQDATRSGPAIARALLKMNGYLQKLEKADACRRSVHVIAYSMGCYLLRKMLQDLRDEKKDHLPRIFDQILLVAADEDEDAFEKDDKLRTLTNICKGVHIYFNNEDKALKWSDWFKGNPGRLGMDGLRQPLSAPARVFQVNCTPVVEGGLEHDYFKNERVIRDMKATLDGVDPDEIKGRRYQPGRNSYIIR